MIEEKIAVVGTGRMGANMARRLKDKGFVLSAVYDAHRPAAEALGVELGVAVPERLAEVSALASIILTVVTDDRAMDAIFSSSGDSLLAGGHAGGRLFVNCATLSPGMHVEVERRERAVGAEVLEACMASSIPQAREGTLYLMCGGAVSSFERARRVLEALSASMRHVGGTGRAAQLKALVNMVMNMNTAALAEGLGLADALGLDLAMVREVFSQTGANSRVLQTDGEDMQNRDHACFFSGAHAAKDSGIALALAEEAGLVLPLAQATKAQFDRLVAAGKGELDKSGIAELTFLSRRS
jgi:3-hydroxyisobutyrate dehydrogenase